MSPNPQSQPSTLRNLQTQFGLFIKLLPAIVMLILAISITANMIGQYKLYTEVGKQVEVRKADVQKQEQKLVGLRNALQYAKTDTFVERWARVKLQYAKPGENVVIVPADVLKNSSQKTQTWIDEFLD